MFLVKVFVFLFKVFVFLVKLFVFFSSKYLCFFSKYLCFFLKYLCFFPKYLCFFSKYLCFFSKSVFSVVHSLKVSICVCLQLFLREENPLSSQSEKIFDWKIFLFGADLRILEGNFSDRQTSVCLTFGDCCALIC